MPYISYPSHILDKSAKRFRFRFQTSALVIFIFSAALLAGCGGGGGGGGSTPPPPAVNTPVQSNWSPAKSAFINTKSPAITFQTNKAASCRWSLADAAFDSMTNLCSGAGTQSQSCNVSGLPEGGTAVYLACTDANGDKDTAATNTNVPYTVDTIPPTIQFTAPPNASGPYSPAALPNVVSVNYSDTNSGADPSKLLVTVTLMNRTVSIAGLFGHDPVANASSSRTDPSLTNPFIRTTVSRFSSADFNHFPPQFTGTTGRCGADTQRISSDGIVNQIYVWDTECDIFWVISSDDFRSIQIAGSKIAAVAGDGNHIYVGLKDDPHLYFYNKTSYALDKTLALPDAPTALATALNGSRLFIAYKSRAEIGRLNSSDALAAPVPISVTPLFISSWKHSDGSDDDILAIGWQSQYRLFQITQSGTILKTINVGASAPKDMEVYDFNSVFVSMYADGSVRKINMADGSFSDAVIGAQSAPRGLFAAGTQLLVSNSGADGRTPTITFLGLNNLDNEGSLSLNVPITDGLYVAGTAQYYALEDIWQIQSQQTITLTATIKDRAGNTSAPASISITVAPEVPGGA